MVLPLRPQVEQAGRKGWLKLWLLCRIPPSAFKPEELFCLFQFWPSDWTIAFSEACCHMIDSVELGTAARA